MSYPPSYPQAVQQSQGKGSTEVPIMQQPHVQYHVPQQAAMVQQPNIQVHMASPQPAFREFPLRTVCPYCNLEVLTSTQQEIGTYSWLMCFVIAIVGGCLGCCLIPFFLDQCKNVVHSCPRCERPIGRFDRSNAGYYPHQY